MAKDARTNEVLNIKELSQYLKISRSTLYKLSQNGSLPGQKIGRHWRFHKDTIDRWLGENPKARGTTSKRL